MTKLITALTQDASCLLLEPFTPNMNALVTQDAFLRGIGRPPRLARP